MRRRLVSVVAAALVVGGVGGPVAAADHQAVVSVTAAATTTVQGVVQRLAVDLRGGGTVYLTYVVPATGAPVRIRTADLAHVTTASRVSAALSPATSTGLTDPAAGARVVSSTVLTSSVATGTGNAARRFSWGEPIDGSGRPITAVLATVGAQPPGGLSTDDVAGDLAEVRLYFEQSTGHQVTLEPTAPVAGGAYSGWGPSGCTDRQILGLVDWAAHQAGLYPAVENQRHVVLYTPRMSVCGAVASVSHMTDGGVVWLNGQAAEADRRWIAAAHGVGHTLTLGESNTRLDCPIGPGAAYDETTWSDGAPCTEGVGGDAYDVMGTIVEGAPGLLNAAHRDALGLLAPALEPGGTDDWMMRTLRRYGDPVHHLESFKVVTNRATYYVEWRAAVGRDADLATTRTGCPAGGSCTAAKQARFEPGVVVRRVDDATAWRGSFLLEAEPWRHHLDPEPQFVLGWGDGFTAANGRLQLVVFSWTEESATFQVRVDEPAVAIGLEDAPSNAWPTGWSRPCDNGWSLTADGWLVKYFGLCDGRLSGTRALYDLGDDVVAVLTPGDWDGFPWADIIEQDTAGDLWLWPGWSDHDVRKIGWGWAGYRVSAPGDLSGDGTLDLLAIDPKGLLWLYPGNGTGGFGRRVQVGNGWIGYDLYPAADVNRDGHRDILSVDGAGRLWLYLGRGGGFFHQRRQVGNGWSTYLLGAGGDLNMDGYGDLLGVAPDGRLYFYAGRAGGGFAGKVLIDTGW